MTLDSYISSLRGKRIAVIGLGVSNRPLLERLLEAGCAVTVRDRREDLGEAARELEARGCRLRLGEGYLAELEEDIIFRTPGLHPFTPELAEARRRGAELTSEMEAFFRLCPCRTIAVTGSDGKTTTSTIVAELLKAAGKRVHLGGNIGTPLLCRVGEMGPEDWAVLELSSFQLHSMHCRPDVAVITNVSPNHLDIHPSYEDYQDAKKQIYRSQGPEDVLVLNRDNEITRAMAAEAPGRVRWFSRRKDLSAHPDGERDGAFWKEGAVWRWAGGQARPIVRGEEIFIPGMHNVENYMAAFAATQGIVPDECCRQVAGAFRGVPHRLEILRTLRGVTYCNDSIASSPTRTIAGLRALKQKPILIAGGYDKHLAFDELGDEICRRVKSLYLTGDTAGKIRDAVTASGLYDPRRLPIHMEEDFRQAVLAAAASAREGDMVLLSPACASFDHFKNFAQRGDTFRRIVMELE